MSKETDQQNEVQRKLDELYIKDGRDNPEHPFHRVYTGLFIKYHKEAPEA